jgi:RNA methyltransferase, TrmH family
MTTSPAAPRLTNPRAERVKAVRALSGRSVRLRTGRFLVEGPQSVREVVREAADRVRDVYVTPAAAERYADVVADAVGHGVRVHDATDEVVAAMSPDAQGLLAVAETHDPGLAAVLARRPLLVAVLARVRDPGNAGTVIRAADAAGAGAVVLTAESVDVHNPKVVRSTAGSLFHLPVTAGSSLADVTTALRAAGLQVLAADGSGEHDLDELLDVVPVPARDGTPPGAGPRPSGRGDLPDLTRPTAWVFGNEAWGLPAEDRALADAVVRVPIRGRAESLNLATAATVCLYASSRAQR